MPPRGNLFRERPAADRFDEKYIVVPNGCWLWTGCVSKKGYGTFSWNSSTGSTAAHRYAYERFVGPIPPNMQIDHRCRERSCVNWRHLEVVTNAENQRRALPFNRQRAETRCSAGHEYNEINTRTVYYSDGRYKQRVRRPCHRKWLRAFYARQKAGIETGPRGRRVGHQISRQRT